ncbi:MAG: hypothetical protein AAGL68_01535 [Pseudomonadota bacterium]
MDWGGPGFVITIIAISTLGWLINNWIRAKHGYELEDEWGGKSKRKDNAENSAETKRLKAENSELNEKIDMMQDRMIVLEKIVTDRGYSLSDEIEALRDKPGRTASDSGVPLNINSQEKA